MQLALLFMSIFWQKGFGKTITKKRRIWLILSLYILIYILNGETVGFVRRLNACIKLSHNINDTYTPWRLAVKQTWISTRRWNEPCRGLRDALPSCVLPGPCRARNIDGSKHSMDGWDAVPPGRSLIGREVRLMSLLLRRFSPLIGRWRCQSQSSHVRSFVSDIVLAHVTDDCASLRACVSTCASARAFTVDEGLQNPLLLLLLK